MGQEAALRIMWDVAQRIVLKRHKAAEEKAVLEKVKAEQANSENAG
jgi:hypothetical protein